MTDATGTGNCGVVDGGTHTTGDDSGPMAESGRVDILTSTYTS